MIDFSTLMKPRSEQQGYLLHERPNLPVTMSRNHTGDAPQDDDLSRSFQGFLETGTDLYNYEEDIASLLQAKRTRLIVNIDDLRDHDRELSDGLLKQPIEHLSAFEDGLNRLINAAQGNFEQRDIDIKTYRVGLSGSFGDHHVSPRTLQAVHLNKMISLEGIITRCSLVRPKMVRSVHYCPETRLFHSRDYRDALTSLSNEPPTSSITPQTDDDGHQLQMEFGHCVFHDHQRISIQEMPERAPAGQLPRSIDIILEGDLVDKCKPGDRIQLVGIYRSIGGGANGTFK